MRRILFSLTALGLFVVLTGCKMVTGVCDCPDPGSACLCGACGYQDVLKHPAPDHGPIYGHPVQMPSPTPIYGSQPLEHPSTTQPPAGESPSQPPLKEMPKGEPPAANPNQQNLPNVQGGSLNY